MDKIVTAEDEGLLRRIADEAPAPERETALIQR